MWLEQEESSWNTAKYSIQTLMKFMEHTQSFIPHKVLRAPEHNNNNGYSALGSVWQEPEPSQATGMALVCCILGKFLGGVCNCFPPCLDIPTFASRCLHVLNDTRDPSSEIWNYGWEMSGNFAYMTSQFMPLGIFYMLQIYGMGQTALLPLRRKECWRFFCP
jgi:hypothetical protein